MGNRARVVLEVANQAAGKVLPTMITIAAACIKYELQKVQFLSSCSLFYLLPHFKKHNCCLVPGMQVPETIERVCWIRSIVHEQLCQLTEVKHATFAVLIIDKLACQSRIGSIEEPSLLALQLESTCHALSNVGGWIAAHTRL